MRERLIKAMATGFGAGCVPLAPGAAGSVVGLAYWWLLTTHVAAVWQWLIVAAVLSLAVWCSDEAARLYRHPDPPRVVIDEIAAVPLALGGIGPQVWKVAVVFVLFRVFDVVKPPPARQAQHFRGGLGIVLDDVVAALYACAAGHLVVAGVDWLRG
jgi:phosphatidylglycerophosphatase A